MSPTVCAFTIRGRVFDRFTIDKSPRFEMMHLIKKLQLLLATYEAVTVSFFIARLKHFGKIKGQVMLEQGC